MPGLCGVFIMEGCSVLSKVFFLGLLIRCFLYFINTQNYINRFSDLNPNLYFWDKFTWSQCILLFIGCWIQFVSILLRVFTAIFRRNIGPQLSFLIMSYLVLIQGNIQPYRMSWEVLVDTIPLWYLWSHLCLSFLICKTGIIIPASPFCPWLLRTKELISSSFESLGAGRSRVNRVLLCQ